MFGSGSLITGINFFVFDLGPSDLSLNLGGFESFEKVPTFLRPHPQIFCTR
jgi:hypothetical protein